MLLNDMNPEILSAGMVDIDLSALVMLVLFLVFAVLLHMLVLKPLIAAQESRHASMGGAREGASESELRAAELRLEYEARLTKARQDAVLVREQLKNEATAEAHGIVSAVETETKQRLADGQATLRETGKKARVDMKAHAEQLSTELAAKLLGGKA